MGVMGGHYHHRDTREFRGAQTHERSLDQMSLYDLGPPPPEQCSQTNGGPRVVRSSSGAERKRLDPQRSHIIL